MSGSMKSGEAGSAAETDYRAVMLYVVGMPIAEEALGDSEERTARSPLTAYHTCGVHAATSFSLAQTIDAPLCAASSVGWFHEVTSFSPIPDGAGKKRKQQQGGQSQVPPTPMGHMAVNFWFHPPDNLQATGAAGVAKPYKSEYWWVHAGGCSWRMQHFCLGVVHCVLPLPGSLFLDACCTSPGLWM